MPAETALLPIDPAAKPANAGELMALPADTTDGQFLHLWVNRPRRSQSAHTVNQYRRIADRFLAYTSKPLQAMTYADLAAWVESLTGSPNSQRAQVAVIKSLFSFGLKVGYFRFNPAVMLETPAAQDSKHQRILSEEEIYRMLAAAKFPATKPSSGSYILPAAGCRSCAPCGGATCCRWATAKRCS